MELDEILAAWEEVDETEKQDVFDFMYEHFDDVLRKAFSLEQELENEINNDR